MSVQKILRANILSLMILKVNIFIVGYRLRLHFDGYPENYDFWVNGDSMDIFPVGWSDKNGHRLDPPKGYVASNFNWNAYLKICKATAAPKTSFANKNVSSSSLPCMLTHVEICHRTNDWFHNNNHLFIDGFPNWISRWDETRSGRPKTLVIGVRRQYCWPHGFADISAFRLVGRGLRLLG